MVRRSAVDQGGCRRISIRVLALSVDIGAGHRRAAEALRDTFLSLEPTGQLQIVEALEYLGPLAGRLAKELYLGVVKEAPDLWGMLYEERGLLDFFRPIGELVDDLRTGELAPVVRSFQPDVILAMHPVACGLAAAIGRKRMVDCPVVAVLTDFDAHPAWIARGIDLYCTPTARVARELARQGLPTGKAADLGIPIRRAFERIRDDTTARSRLGLPESRFTILLLGGGLGLGPIAEAAEALASLDGPLQMILIAGKNRELEERARTLARRSKVPLHVTGLVENIWDYMSAADLAIGKPGGLTCAELLAVGIPLVALAPIPGQEQANSDELVAEGVAIHAPSAVEAKAAVLQLLLSPGTREKMRQAALRMGRPTAARNTVRHVLALIEQKRGLQGKRATAP